MTGLTFMDSLNAIVGDRGVVTKARCAALSRDTQEVFAAVRLCASVGVPMVPHGEIISAEHGIGQYRINELERSCSPPELERHVNHALDPSGLMNPSKVLTLLNVEK